MRYRVDLNYGSYISVVSKEEAFRLYEECNGIRIRECKDIFDDGIVIYGDLIFEDFTETTKN